MEKDLIDFLKERDVKYHTGIPWLFDEEDSEFYDEFEDRLDLVEPRSLYSFLKRSDFPKHPDVKIIQANDFYKNGLSEREIWAYYDSKKNELIKQLNRRDGLFVLGVDGTVIKRHIKIESLKDFDKNNSGRLLEFHIVVGKSTDIMWVDLDPKEDFPFEETKIIAKDLVERFSKLSEIKNIDLKFSGSRGFHLLLHSKKTWNVDEARKWVQVKCQEYIDEKNDSRLTTGLTKEKNAMRLDVSTLHDTGSIRAAWSLNAKTGLISLPLSIKQLINFKKDDAKIKISKLAEWQSGQAGSGIQHLHEDIGYPPTNWYDQSTAFIDFVKELDLKPDEEELDDLASAPYISPSWLFSIAKMDRKAQGAVYDFVYYINQKNPSETKSSKELLSTVSNFPKDLTDPRSFPPSVVDKDGNEWILERGEETAKRIYERKEELTKQKPSSIKARINESLSKLPEIISTGREYLKLIKRNKMFSSDKVKTKFMAPDLSKLPTVLDSAQQNFEKITEKLKTEEDKNLPELFKELEAVKESTLSFLKTVSGYISNVENSIVYIDEDGEVWDVARKMLREPLSTERRGVIIQVLPLNVDGEEYDGYDLITEDGSNIFVTELEVSKQKKKTWYIVSGGLYWIGYPIKHYLKNMKSKDEIAKAVNEIEKNKNIANRPIFGSKRKDYQDYFPGETETTTWWEFYPEEDPTTVYYVPDRFLQKGKSTFSKLIRPLTKLGAYDDTSTDRPPYSFRDYPEMQEITLEQSPIDVTLPFFEERLPGDNALYLSLPNVGDVAGERRNTRGYSGPAEYSGKRDLQLAKEEEEMEEDVKSQLRKKYEEQLEEATNKNYPSSIIDHYRLMIKKNTV